VRVNRWIAQDAEIQEEVPSGSSQDEDG